MRAQASALEARQGRYEELQGQLLSSAQQLATRSAQLQGAIDTVLVYERRSEAVLGYLMGRWDGLGAWAGVDLG